MDITERKTKNVAATFGSHLLNDNECFIEASEWQNGEGVHLSFGDEQQLSLTWQQMRALSKLLDKFLHD